MIVLQYKVLLNAKPSLFVSVGYENGHSFDAINNVVLNAETNNEEAFIIEDAQQQQQ